MRFVGVHQVGRLNALRLSSKLRLTIIGCFDIDMWLMASSLCSNPEILRVIHAQGSEV